MMFPREIVEMLDSYCWKEQLIGVYQILHGRFRDDTHAQEMLKRDLTDIDPGYFEFSLG